MDSNTNRYRIRLETNGKSLLDSLGNAYNEEKFTDIVFVSGAECNVIKGHKMILSNCSPYFKKIIECTNDLKFPYPIVPFVVIKEIASKDLKDVIDFIYKGDVIITRDRVNSMLKAAQLLEIKSLEECIICLRNKLAEVKVLEDKSKEKTLVTEAVNVNVQKVDRSANQAPSTRSANLKTLDIVSNLASDGSRKTIANPATTVNLESISKSPLKTSSESGLNSALTVINIDSPKALSPSSCIFGAPISLPNEKNVPRSFIICKPNDKMLFTCDNQNFTQKSTNVLQSTDLSQKAKARTDLASENKTVAAAVTTTAAAAAAAVATTTTATTNSEVVTLKATNNTKAIPIVLSQFNSLTNNQILHIPAQDLNSSLNVPLRITKPMFSTLTTTITKDGTSSTKTVQITRVPSSDKSESKLDHNYSSVEVNKAINIDKDKKHISELSSSCTSQNCKFNFNQNADKRRTQQNKTFLSFESRENLFLTESTRKYSRSTSSDVKTVEPSKDTSNSDQKSINSKQSNTPEKNDKLATNQADSKDNLVASITPVHEKEETSSKEHSIGTLHRKTITTTIPSSSSASSSSSLSSVNTKWTEVNKKSTPASNNINNKKEIISSIIDRPKRTCHNSLSKKSEHSSTQNSSPNQDVIFLGESTGKLRSRKTYTPSVNERRRQTKYPRLDYEDIAKRRTYDTRPKISNSKWPRTFESAKFSKELASKTYERRTRRATRSEYSH